jgi:hypothetical protein
LGFPGYKDQSALGFLKGRSSRFSSILRCLFNYVEARNFLVMVLVLYYDGIYSSVLVLREPWIS